MGQSWVLTASNCIVPCTTGKGYVSITLASWDPLLSLAVLLQLHLSQLALLCRRDIWEAIGAVFLNQKNVSTLLFNSSSAIKTVLVHLPDSQVTGCLYSPCLLGNEKHREPNFRWQILGKVSHIALEI